MKILGIDPGMAIVGYGLIEGEDNNFKLLASGSIQTEKSLDDSKRLLDIYKDLSTIVEKYKPDCASVEQLFFFKNQKRLNETKNIYRSTQVLRYSLWYTNIIKDLFST